MTDEDIASAILRRHNAAKTDQGAWISIWSDLAQYVKPDRDCIGLNAAFGKTPNSGRFDLFDGTAQHGNLIYASGCMAYLTPADDPWFRFDPPQALNDNENVKQWTQEVTEITQQDLATSNFYSQIHESWLEDGAFGTQSIACEPGDKHPLRFTSHEIGDYAILENHNGEVDTWFHEFSLTHRQAVQKFGEANLPAEVVEYVKLGGEKADEKRMYLHCIYPREDAERDMLKLDGENMPWASVYLCQTSRKIVRKTGFWEMPVAVGRHIKWGKTPWGIAPGLFALADQRQLNDLQKNMDALAEVAAFPRIQAHTEQEGEIDLRSSGVTWYKDPNHIAKEWLTGGRYDIGLDRVKERQEAVKRAYHVDLFQMFAGIPVTKEMTKAEVVERRRERLTLFHPTFARKTSEVLTPLLRRVFALLLRSGRYPRIPEELIRMTGPGRAEILDPEVTYTSRIALELKAIQSSGLQQTLGEFAPVASFKPEVFDAVDFDRAFRDSLRNRGVPEDWITKPDVVERIREARAQAEQEAAAKQEAAAAVETAATAQKAGLMDGIAA